MAAAATTSYLNRIFSKSNGQPNKLVGLVEALGVGSFFYFLSSESSTKGLIAMENRLNTKIDGAKNDVVNETNSGIEKVNQKINKTTKEIMEKMDKFSSPK